MMILVEILHNVSVNKLKIIKYILLEPYLPNNTSQSDSDKINANRMY